MQTRELKESFFKETASIFKVLSSPIRLKLLNYISFCPRTVEACAYKFNQSMQNISLHLQSLSRIGMLEVRKEKNYRIYSLSEERVLEVLGSRLIAAPRTILPKELSWEESLESLADSIAAKKLILIDLREPEERLYIPVSQALGFKSKDVSIETFLQSLPKKKELVFFCRGKWCERMASTVMSASKIRTGVKGVGLNAMQLKQLNSFIVGS